MPSSILNLKFKGNKSFVAFSNLGDSDSLTKTWKVCSKVASYLEQGQRLENLSWRLWHLQNLIVESDNAKSKREFRKLSKCMGDKLDKEKGRSIVELEAPGFKHNQNTDKLRMRAEEKERTRELHHQGKGINRMQFTFSVDQPAHITPASALNVKKPDLKPSTQFRDTVGRRRPNTRATANGHSHGSGATAKDDSPQDADMNDRQPLSLTSIGRKPSPPEPTSANSTTFADDATLHDSDSDSRTATNNSLYSAGSWNDSAVSLRFPGLFTSDFGPSALLFPQPSLMTPLSYGEDAASTAPGATGERLMVARPTIEIPLDELLGELSGFGHSAAAAGADMGMGMDGIEDDGSPGSWDGADVEMKAAPPSPPSSVSTRSHSASSPVLSVPPMSAAAREALPTTIHPSQVNGLQSPTTTTTSTSTATANTSAGGRSGKPNLTVKTNGSSVSTRSGGGSSANAAGGSMNPPASSVPGNGSSGSSGSSGNSAPGGVKAECNNCGATHTPLWRRGLNDELNCNACGLYCKLHKRPRPKSMRNTHGEGRSQAPSRTDNVDSAGEPAQCYNCHTMATPLWRKDDEGKTVCNACGLYFKLHGSARPISMKSDVIRKRSRHDARRIGPGETPSASPGASRRASPTSVQPPQMQDLPSPTLAPDSSTAPSQMGYNYHEDYDFHHMQSPPQSELMGALGTDNSGVYSSGYDLALAYGSFPGPYHPDYLGAVQQNGQNTDVHPYASGDSPGSQGGEHTNVGCTREGNATKRRRMSVDNAADPPSSSSSYSSYADHHHNTHSPDSASTTSVTYGYGGYRGYAPSLRGSGAFWHPPMMPQEKSPHAFPPIHPPMLPANGNAGACAEDFAPMDFLHPPMIPVSGDDEHESLFASFLHPPMALTDDLPMNSPYGHAHPPMLPSDGFYGAKQQQQRLQLQHNQGQNGQQDNYY